MAHYTRSTPHQARASDQVQALLSAYPSARQEYGITVKEFLWEHPDQLKCAASVIAAIDLLTEEGKVIREKSIGHQHPFDGIRIFPLG
jgi:hypothetical protein